MRTLASVRRYLFDHMVSLRHPDILRFFEIMWKNICRAGQATDDNTARADFMMDNKGHKHTHSECVIFFVSPLQHLIQERPSMLRYMYSAYLVIIKLAICTYDIYKTIHSRPHFLARHTLRKPTVFNTYTELASF